MNRAVQFKHALRSCQRMQPVNVLCDHAGHFSGTLQFRQLSVRGVGKRVLNQQFFTVEVIKFFRMCHEKAVGQNGFRRIAELLMIKPVRAAKIRHPAFGRNTGTAEKDNPGRTVNQILQCFPCHKNALLLPCAKRYNCAKRIPRKPPRLTRIALLARHPFHFTV